VRKKHEDWISAEIARVGQQSNGITALGQIGLQGVAARSRGAGRSEMLASLIRIRIKSQYFEPEN
jgi:hypothetical protein